MVLWIMLCVDYFKQSTEMEVKILFKSWTIKKGEHQRIDAFEGCWRRLLRVPWTAQRSNQSILKEISPEYSLEGLCWSWNSNTLATWCEKLTHLKRPWCRERLKAGGEGDDRGWDGWIASQTQWTWVWASSGSWWLTWRPGVLQSMGSQRVRHNWVTWTEMEKRVWELGPIYCHSLVLKTSLGIWIVRSWDKCVVNKTLL